MASSNILGIGKSGLAAAQIGVATTGHNITNAATPGYNRQVIVQASAGAQDSGFGFVGKGSEIVEIKRIYDNFLGVQVNAAQTSKSSLDSYFAQISRINNLVADPAAGLSPALQDFFKGVQDLAANPTSAASRQSVLSTGQALTTRFQSLDGQVSEIRDSINKQITASISSINSFATQIAKLNDSIELAQSASIGKPANDLLDQRDQLIAELNQEVKATVVPQGNTYNVFIGNGQPLVVGTTTSSLVAAASPTDLTRTVIGIVSNGVVSVLPENVLPGGKLGGLFDFRSNTLDVTQNSLGRVAVGLATTFNAQHQLGQDLNGALGGAFFNAAAPVVNANSGNTGTAVVAANITNVGLLTTSDYRLQFVGGNYNLTRLSDNVVLSNTTFAAAQAAATATEGFNFSLTSGAFAANDSVVIRPTRNGAGGIGVLVADKTKIAVAAPIRTSAPLSNLGSGKISPGAVDATYPAAPPALPVTFTYNSPATTFTVAPANIVTVTLNGVAQPGSPFAAGTPVTYTAGATYTFGGAANTAVSFTFSGSPVNGDTFTVSANTNGVGDSRNAVLLGALQSGNTLDKNTTTYQGAYGQLVSLIGNKTRELDITSSAEGKRLTEVKLAQQAQSGVNLDEEAANLLRYQQAYQASGKLMKTASELFDVLLSLGR